MVTHYTAAQDQFTNGLLTKLFGKKAQKKMDDKTCKLLSMYVIVLRSLYLIHQQNHWSTKGYETHLLFQRLYEGVLEDVDAAAERTIGITGELLYTGMENEISKKFQTLDKNALAYLTSSINAEKEYQKVAKNLYNILKETDELTLGLDDMLMSQAGNGEERIYLLQQTIQNYT
jgi:DNA-binding ferritin-like protein